MIEYPKVIVVGGVTLTVQDAAEEARWREAPLVSFHAAPESEDGPVLPIPDVLDDPDGAPPADPLDDLSIEMDNPVYNEPVKKKKPRKKKTSTIPLV